MNATKSLSSFLSLTWTKHKSPKVPETVLKKGEPEKKQTEAKMQKTWSMDQKWGTEENVALIEGRRGGEELRLTRIKNR